VKVQARFVSRQNDLEVAGLASEGGKRILPELAYVSTRSALLLAQDSQTISPHISRGDIASLYLSI
jgi:hypothetical protein